MITPEILTIGHSNHSIEDFTKLLRAHHVTALADVRSSPYSGANPDFNREFLQQRLKASGIIYVYLGRELGARPDNPSFYQDGKVQYRMLSRSLSFRRGLRRILTGAQSYRVALVCAEKEPLVCHRTLLIARELVTLGAPVSHIHADSSLELHGDAMTRLVSTLGMSYEDLYRTKEQIIADACVLQEQRIAYVDKDLREEASA